MRSIGFDFGSVYTKAVLLDGEGNLALTCYAKNGEDDRRLIGEFLAEAAGGCPDARFLAGATGMEPAQLPPALHAANAVIAIAEGAHRLHPGVKSVVEIGGQTAKFLALGEDGSVRDFATNDACAAGTGSFLAQQARRLGLDVEALSRLSTSAPRGATIAGRCAVFAKSDMIHLQQKGTSPEEICFGLCLAIARNAVTLLLRGRDIASPVLIAGGCARNAGILRAFREVMGIGEAAGLLPSAHPGLEGALGAALGARAAGLGGLTRGELRGFLEAAAVTANPGEAPSHPPLAPRHEEARPAEPADLHDDPQTGWLGVDVGSVSTDFVVLDRAGVLLSAVYLPTRGRPVEVLREGLEVLRGRFRGGLTVLGCGATGSGRHLAARHLGADVEKNEITCQLLGARAYVPEADSILEIGGQDSKFISVKDGGIADFVMNKICAAGTGSFLEEQAQELGVEITRDFAPLVFAARRPGDLGSRCSVFMETEVVNAARRGVPREDICAGLARSIVENYLAKVVGRRPLGNTVVFQGGVASNRAVVATFEAVLGRPVRVHPFNRISGAIGAALAAQAAMAGRATAFKGLDPGPRPALRSFECARCSNGCEVTVIESAAGKVYFGDTCERFTSRGEAATAARRLPNLAQEYLARCEAYFAEPANGRPRVGIPRASTLVGYLPFWATFLQALGLQPVLSKPTSPETLALGLKHLPVGVCLPIRLTAGHVQALLEDGVDRLFLPSLVVLPGDDPAQSYACPYTTALPFMIGGAPADRVLAPIVSFESEEAFVGGFETWRDWLGASKHQLRAAYRQARAAQEAFEASLRGRACEVLAAGEFTHVFAVLGKPYTTFDAFLNLDLFERLRRLGVLGVPLTYLPVSGASELPWRFSADIHRAAAACGSGRGMYPVILSHFGCGPDAFTFKKVEVALRGTPHLVLEFDEHRGEVGLITRLEAFLDRIQDGGERRVPAREPAAAPAPVAHIPAAPAEIRIPYFADHAYAFSGLLRFKGHRAAVLPLPGTAVRLLGEKYALGKECHPYLMMAGDLVNLHRQEPGRDLVFYLPGTSIPCLLHEYGPGMQALLGDLGIERITVSSPTGQELFDAVGIEGRERFYLGLLAIELLVKALCEVRPYETVPGAADCTHHASLRRIESAIAEGDVVEALDESLRALGAIPVQRNGGRPVVGIAGDIYTKVNPAGNNGLYRWLEDRGLEVWPAPFQIDVVVFGISRRFFESAAKLSLKGLLLHGSIALRRLLDVWKIHRVAARRIARLEEPGYRAMQALAAPYMPNEEHELLFLNTVKIVDFARRGADGIINATCFNCMVGNASAAIVEKVRRDYPDLPIVTAVYAGGEDPSRRMVLEAFVSQVKAHHVKRNAAPRAA